MSETNWDREAGKVDPDGFTNLEGLTRDLLKVPKSELKTASKGAELPDDDPEVVAGMQRLRELRESEHEVDELNL